MPKIGKKKKVPKFWAQNQPKIPTLYSQLTPSFVVEFLRYRTQFLRYRKGWHRFWKLGVCRSKLPLWIKQLNQLGVHLKWIWGKVVKNWLVVTTTGSKILTHKTPNHFKCTPSWSSCLMHTRVFELHIPDYQNLYQLFW